MGVCQPEPQRQAQFTASFSANLRVLYESYKQILEFLKPSDLFSQNSEQLNHLIDTYLQNHKIIDKENLGICAIDSVCKLHPLDYGTANITKDWLLSACLRQNKFIKQFPYQLLNFEQCYRHYVEFLYLCFKTPQSIVVPNKLADFMWHSHMQDNQKYKIDLMKMLKKVLNHLDDMQQDQMKRLTQETERNRKRFLREPQRKGSFVSHNYHSYNFINYGPSMCGGGHYPHPHPPNPPYPYPPDPYPGPDPSPDPYPHPPIPPPNPNPYDVHPHPSPPNPHPHPSPHQDSKNDYNSHNYDYGGYSTDHNAGGHSSCGGGGQSSCGGGGQSNCGGGGQSSCGGGGASSCGGGGASSCGGGGSSCGGGGSSCGGGGSD